MRFIKMIIIDDNTFLDKCKTISQIHVFTEICKSMDQNQLWYSNSESRGSISTKLNLSDVRIKQIVKELTDVGLLHKKMKGIYIISQVYMSIIKD